MIGFKVSEIKKLNLKKNVYTYTPTRTLGSDIKLHAKKYSFKA